MEEIDFITALGRWLRDGRLRDAFAVNPQTVAEQIKLTANDWPGFLQLRAADLEFQARILLRKRFDLVQQLLPETMGCFVFRSDPLTGHEPETVVKPEDEEIMTIAHRGSLGPQRGEGVAGVRSETTSVVERKWFRFMGRDETARVVENQKPPFRFRQSINEQAWPAFFQYARSKWPEEPNPVLHDAFQFCRLLRQENIVSVSDAEWSRLNFALSKNRLSIYGSRRGSHAGESRLMLQVFVRLFPPKWYEFDLFFKI